MRLAFATSIPWPPHHWITGGRYCSRPKRIVVDPQAILRHHNTNCTARVRLSIATLTPRPPPNWITRARHHPRPKRIIVDPRKICSRKFCSNFHSKHQPRWLTRPPGLRPASRMVFLEGTCPQSTFWELLMLPWALNTQFRGVCSPPWCLLTTTSVVATSQSRTAETDRHYPTRRRGRPRAGRR